MKNDLFDLIPKTKFETEKVDALIQLGYPAVQPILPELMTWVQDMNWPVARVLRPFLVSIGAPLEPYIREILKTDDDNWKYWIISDFIGDSKQLFEIFKPELERIALNPTVTEKIEELDELAKSILGKNRK
jgi:hypothetical protein